MANFGNVKFFYGSDISKAITLSSENAGSFYIVAGDADESGVKTSGVIALNGHAWYEAAGGITSVGAGTSGTTAGFAITETDGTTSTTKFIPFVGNEGSGVNTSVAVNENGQVVYSASLKVATASSVTSGIQLANVDSTSKELDASLALEYATETGVLSIKNGKGESVSVNLPLESFLEDAVYKESKASAQEWVSGSSYSGISGVTDVINAMEDVPSLILIMHTQTREGLTVHTEDKAIVVPITSLLQTYSVASSANTMVVTSSDASNTKTFNVEANNDAVTIKQYTNAETNGFTKDGISANELYASDAIIESDIKVTMSSTLGNLAKSGTIPAGTSVIELLKQILCKVINPKVGSTPSAGLSVNQPWTSTTYEVGTVFDASSRTLTASYTDGEFTSSDSNAWSYNVAAGCVGGTYNIQTGTSSTSVETSVQNTTATTYTFPSASYTGSESTQVIAYAKNSVAYEASTTQAVDSNGSNYDLSIEASTANSNSVTVAVPACKYKWYLGCSTATTMTEAVVKSLTVSSTGWCNINSDTTLKDSFDSDGTSIVIAIPSKYKLTGIKDAAFHTVDYTDNFVITAISDFGVAGDSTAAYNVYVWTNTSGNIASVINITIGKA